MSQRGKKMTTACIRNLVEKYSKLAKEAHPELFPEPKYSPHSFRHSKAVHMVESGVQLVYIRNFLGHVSVQSTEIYARIGQNAVAKMLTERGKHGSPKKSDDSTIGDKSVIYPKFLDRARRK
jgi:site-specific recombinase XerD